MDALQGSDPMKLWRVTPKTVKRASLPEFRFPHFEFCKIMRTINTVLHCTYTRLNKSLKHVHNFAVCSLQNFDKLLKGFVMEFTSAAASKATIPDDDRKTSVLPLSASEASNHCTHAVHNLM